MSSCYKTSNNKYFNLPPRMDDARHFTDYRPNCLVNNHIKSENKIMNSYEYRMFLTRNANKLIDLNRGYATEKNSCGPCTNTMLPEQSVQSCSSKSCSTILFTKSSNDILGSHFKSFLAFEQSAKRVSTSDGLINF